jgi:hypothetical protein
MQPTSAQWRGRRTTGLCAVVFALGTWLASGRCFAADVSDADRALAAKLFKEGRALMASEDYAEACSRLETSQRLDPGGGTLLNLALCHELAGATATAWSEFTEAATVARHDGRPDRESEAQRHSDALAPRVAHLVIDVPDPARVPGLVVRRDGTRVAEAAWGTAVPIDPGRHVVEAEAPGRVGWQTDVDVEGDGALDTVGVPVPEPVPAPAPIPSPSGSVPVSPAPSPPAPREVAWSRTLQAPKQRDWQRPVAVTSGVAGLTGVAVGVAFALHASAQWSDAKREGCSNGICTNDPAFRAWNDSRASASAATVAFISAGAALTCGVVLWLTAPGTKRAVGLAATPGELTMTAAF